MNSTNKIAANAAVELNQSNEKNNTNKEDVHYLKVRLGKSVKTNWGSKVKHGQYIRSMDRQHISEENTFLGPSRVDVKGETESEIISAQDQAKILKRITDGRYRLCPPFDDILEHVIPACAILAEE